MNDQDTKTMQNEHNTLMKVIFGNEQTGEIGMKTKIDEVHELLVQAKAVGGFFGSVKSLAGWLLVMGALIALTKGWLGFLIAWAVNK